MSLEKAPAADIGQVVKGVELKEIAGQAAYRCGPQGIGGGGCRSHGRSSSLAWHDLADGALFLLIIAAGHARVLCSLLCGLLQNGTTLVSPQIMTLAEQIAKR